MIRILESTGFFYFIAWIFLQPIRFMVSASGSNNIPRMGPAIIISNHVSAFDPCKIGPYLPVKRPIHWLAKKELFSFSLAKEQYSRFGVFRWLISGFVVVAVRLSFAIPVDRDQTITSNNIRAFKSSLKLLNRNKIIGVYPEGGVGRISELHPMFVSLAKKTGAHIYPVALSGNKIIFLDPIKIEHYVDDYRNTAKEIMRKIYSEVSL